jgi:hypothetical protein
MSADIYSGNVDRIKEKLNSLNAERDSNYDTLANNIQAKFSGPTGTLAEYTNEWSEVQKLGEGELMGHLVGKGVWKGAKSLYGKYSAYKDAKSAKIQSKNIEEMKGNADDVPDLTERPTSVSNRPRTTDLDEAQDANEDVLGRGSEASNYVRTTGGQGDDVIDSQSDLNLPGRQARQTTNLDDLIGDDAPTAPTAPPTTTTTTTAPEPSPASAENPALSAGTDTAGSFDETLAGAGARSEIQAAATQGRSLGTTIVRNVGNDIDTATDTATSLGGRFVGAVQDAGQSAFKSLAESGSKGYLKMAGKKIGSLFKSSATTTAETTGAEVGTDVGAESALGLGDAVLGAIPIVGEVAMAASGVFALADGIYHLFHSPSAPPPPKLVAPVVAPQNLTAKFSSALPSADNSLDRGASSVSF